MAYWLMCDFYKQNTRQLISLKSTLDSTMLNSSGSSTTDQKCCVLDNSGQLSRQLRVVFIFENAYSSWLVLTAYQDNIFSESNI